MKLEGIKTIAVIGTGQMGAGIAQVSEIAGFEDGPIGKKVRKRILYL